MSLQDMSAAHAEGLHSDLAREFCPDCRIRTHGPDNRPPRDRRDPHVQEIRGGIYYARLLVARLEAAPEPRNEAQEQALALAKQSLALLEENARQEGVEPWATKSP